MSNQVTVKTDIPQTVNYQTCTVQAGTTTTLNPGNNATVTNVGTEYNAILNFSIPRGESAYEQAVEGGYTGTKAEFEELLADLSADLDSLMPKAGGTFTGDVTMASGTAVNFVHTKFYENSADNIVIGDGNGNGLVIMPNGRGAALFYNNGSDYTEVVVHNDIQDTYSSTSSDPISGKGVALAIAGKEDTISDLSTIRSGAAAGATAVQPSDLATVATSGEYTDLINTPSLATVATTGEYSDLSNTPSLAAVATSGDYNDLTNQPIIPNKLDDLDDVSAGSPSDGDGLVYDATNQKWKNGSFTATASWGAISGNLADQADLDNALGDKQDVSTAVTHPISTDVGSATQPVYIDASGAATATTYALNKTVPSDAVFTDTTYSDFVGSDGLNPGKSGLVPAPDDSENTKFLKGDGTWATVDALPSQTGQTGKFLTTDGSSASWTDVDALPSQTGQSGKFLTTDGTDASWTDINDPIPSQAGNAGKFLTTDGSDVSWADVDALPPQAGADGKFLTTDGINASWASLNTPTTKNIGEIVPSILPLTDAGLHLLDGDLLSGGGSYDEFIDYIADLYNSGNYPSLFETDANWQSSVSTYGVCGKFVYDDVNGTVRLPKITGIIEGTVNANALGDLVKAGLPDITGTVDIIPAQTVSMGIQYGQGAFSTTKTSSSGAANSGGASQPTVEISFQASDSDPTYGNSSTVQPQTILGFYYIVVANSVKTEIQVDIDQIATDLNTRANTDLSNLTNIGEVKVANLAMPSDSYVDLTLGVAGDTYTVTSDGYVCIRKVSTAGNQILSIYNLSNGMQQSVCSAGANQEMALVLSIKKGQTFGIWYNLGGATQLFRFIYAEGSRSEA